MATKKFENVRIQLKKDTAANWETNNPILLNGEEILVVTNANEIRKKIGDGEKKYTQLPFTDEPIRTLITGKVDKISGKGLSTNDYTTNEKEKLSNIEEGANKYTHPSTHPATMIITDISRRFVTDEQISNWNSKASTAVVSTTANGLMSSSDKIKLDGIEANANKYTHPTYTSKSAGLYKVTVDNTGHVSNTTVVTKADITGLGIPAQDTTYKSGTGININGTTINHSNAVEPGTAKGDDDRTLSFSGKFTIPTVSYDEQGHITKTGVTTMTMPAKPAEYTHPTTHPATMITDDSTHRFVTDDQIAAWGDKANNTDLTSHTSNKSNPHSVTKSQIGLGNVTNDAQVKKSEMGVANGVATLDNTGKVPSSQLPSYVDDVIEGYYSNNKFHSDSTLKEVIAGESGKIYVDLNENKTYRWSGTGFAVISETLALGETISTAYPGSSGKANADAIKTINEKLSTIEPNANKYTHPAYTSKSVGLYKIAVDSLGHVSNTTAITKTDITGLGIPAQDTTYSNASTTSNGLMSAEDKTKLDGVETNANKYTHPSHNAYASGLYKITTNALGHVTNAIAITKTDITGLGIPAQDTTYKSGTGIKFDGTTINHSNAITAGTAQGDANKTLTFGGTFTIPTITYDAQGHITGKGVTTMTMPSGYSIATTTTNGLMSSTDKTNLQDLLTRVANIETKLQSAVFYG